MKKRILTWALLLVTGISSSFANVPKGTHDNIRDSFKKEFKNAEVIRWESHKAYTKATFRMNDKIMFAYYTGNGQLIAVARNILSDQLPIHLMTTLKNDYSGYWVIDLFEMTNDEESAYYVTLESPDYKLILESVNMNEWTIYKKEKKNLDQ
jgi:hypothetical protein